VRDQGVERPSAVRLSADWPLLPSESHVADFVGRSAVTLPAISFTIARLLFDFAYALKGPALTITTFLSLAPFTKSGNP
jgi:hypothetical protein